MQCDLNYAAQTELPEHAGRTVFIHAVVATVASTALTWAAGEYVLPWVLPYISVSYVIPAILVLAVVAALNMDRSFEENAIRILRNIWFGIWSLMAVAAIPFLLRTEVAVLWLLAVALPITIYFSYRFTTFGVLWITGHPLGDGTVMIRCREIWQYRHEGGSESLRTIRLLDAARQSTPEIKADYERSESGGELRVRHALRTVRSHDYGFLWCFVAVFTGLATAWFSCSEKYLSTIGLQFTVSILLALFTAAMIRCDGRLPLRLLGTMLLRWFYYDTNGQATLDVPKSLR